MISREQAKARLAPSRVRYVVTVKGELCQRDTTAAAVQQGEMARLLADQPSTFYCGPSRWQRLSVCHDGTRWVAEASAVAEEHEEEE